MDWESPWLDTFEIFNDKSCLDQLELRQGMVHPATEYTLLLRNHI